MAKTKKRAAVDTSSVQNVTRLRSGKQDVKEATTSAPAGKPKSGRIWKEKKQRFNSIIKTKGIRDSVEKKKALREQLKRVKETSNAIIEAKKEEKLQKKEKRRQNLKKKEENRKKSEIVQVIKNPSKINKMRRKQMRFIEKRDTN